MPLDLICSQWLMGLFSMNLPLETLFLLWDALILHGHDVLLAAVLAKKSSVLHNISVLPMVPNTLCVVWPCCDIC